MLSLILAEHDGRLVGIAPLMLAHEWRFGLPVRVLRFVGDGTAETDHVTFVLDRQYGAEALHAILGHVDAMPWDIAEFNQTPEEAWMTASLLSFSARRWLCTHEPVSCPVSMLPHSFDDLLAQLPPRFRTAIRSSRRRLHERYNVEFGLHEDAIELPAALDSLFANHGSRWRAKNLPGVFTDPRKRAFYADVSERFRKLGWLRFFFLKLDGRTVAQEFCFVYRDTVMLLQEGFDYAHARENIGNVLRSMVFEYLIERQMRAYDFLAGESRHKRTWATGTANDLRVLCVRTGVYGRTLQALPHALETVKARLRPIREFARRH
jgi:CelD/BcsL family acetyltransferase involved in cellulose biosynthesis